jgi:hypothetical protein
MRALTDLLESQLPLSAHELGRFLVAEAFTPAPLAPAELAAAYKQLGQPPPFRVIRFRGAEIAVPPEARATAVAVTTTAAQFVRWWGVAEISSIVGRMWTTRPRGEAAEATFVRRVLAAMPQLRWLDGNLEWFSLRGLVSRLHRAVRKVFGVLGQVARADLLSVLWKGHSALGHPPAGVMIRYLTDVLDCEVDGETVRLRAPLRSAALTPGEQLLVEALREAGGELGFAELKRAVGDRLPAWKIRHLLEGSPLFVLSGPSRVRLIRPAIAAITTSPG